MVEPIVLAGVAAVVLLMILSAFFSSSEIAMFSLERHRIDSLAEGEEASAATLESLRENPHRLLVTILVGNNVVNIAMTSIATALFAIYVPGGLAVLLTTVIISVLVLVFGESAPKSYAVENTEEWALRIARPLQASQYVMYPAVVFFDHLTRGVNRFTGGRSDIETSYVTRDEIEGLLRTGEEEGVIEEDEREMIQSVFRFTNTIAKEVMTPRLDVVSVTADASLDEVLQTCVENDVTRVPVYRDNLDNIVGIVDIRDIIPALETDATPADIVEPTLHVPETKEIDDLLRELQDERIHLAIVIDEFGSTKGLVTVEDIVEEIVGEIFETEEEEPIERIDDGTITVKGEVNLDEVNEELGIDLPEEGEFETVAGFIYNRMGRLVEEGETVVDQGVTLTVEETENTRILRVRVEKEEQE
ncbi:hemolysin family protein [Haladaptatus sp. F3-133]|uniref:Hemolysin family protein n=1 Tax=Halorutilus salinus TaxID=2487751 RepID=A0A9Q4C1U7_9EURY|nr:hemolysin family protein [Halorutilus salinus]MCX2817768.1 hemolysin family protein [Halorutilus salinus]